MNLKKIILPLFLILSNIAFAQTVQVTPTVATDTACQGDTAFRQVLFTNNGNNPLVIDSIIAPAGFGRKGTYPITISIASTYPNNFASVDFYHEGSTLGLYSDTFLVYSNAANVPRPFKVAASMRVIPSPAVSFNTNDTDQCRVGNSFTFTNTSTISSGTLTYEWIYSDGGGSTATSPTKSFATADTFDILVIATSDLACENSLTKQVIVFPNPAASINNSNTFACFKNHSFTFTDATTIASGNHTVKWYFGDGDTSTVSTPVHSYAKDSSFYRVLLVATSDKQCVGRDSQDIYVYPTPTVGFNVNDSDQCLNGNSYAFTNSSSISSGTLTYNWNFGDATTSTATNPTKTYAAQGTRNVRLIAESDLGCQDTLIKSIVVYRSPVAGFNVNDSTQCFSNSFFSFTNTSTLLTPDTMFYDWRYGDGNTSTDTNTTYQYGAAGSYTAKLVVTSNFGCKDSLSRSISVYPQPVPDFVINDSSQCQNAQNFAFANFSTIPSGSIDGYSWRFGNGDTSNLSAPTKNDYTSSDTFEILLIARSDQNCYDTARKGLIVYPVPVVQYAIPDTLLCFKNHQFIFDDYSSIEYGTMTHNWDFGNGGTSSQADTVYSYPGYATYYPITYTVTSDRGCQRVRTDSVYLYPSPTADYQVADSAQCPRGNSFTFLNNSSVASGSYTSFWKFGSGDTTSQTNPSYAFTFSDTFETVLIVTSDLGCKDSIIKQNIVFPQPTARYKVDIQEQCFPGHVFNFRDTSTIAYGTITYGWDFGDATTSTLATPSKSYAIADTFDITYTVTSDQGCDSTVTGQVYVNPNPVVSFTTNDTAQCINGNQFIYTNTSTVGTGSMFYFWQFGNGSTSTSSNGGAIYIATDTLTVRLRVTTDKNCVDSARQTVYIFPKPQVNFNTTDPIQCFTGNSFDFINTSTIEWGTLSYDWDLDDGTQTTQTSLVHSYATADTFRVKLKGTSAVGCSDSIYRNMYVHPIPVAAFTVDTPAQCITDNEFTFTNASTISGGTISYSWNFGDFNGDGVENPPPHVYGYADTFEVVLVAISDKACNDTARLTVYVTEKPDPTFTGFAKQYCVNGPIVTLTPAVPGGTFSGDNITADQFNPSFIGWNRVQYAINLNGCADTAVDSTLVVPYPSVDLGFDTVFCQDDFYTLNVPNLGATYLWSDSSTRSFYRITTPGTHWVSVSNACGVESDSVDVTYLDFHCDAFIPNAFTPEGNTVNDYFMPQIDTTIVKGIQFMVFSRWGTKIFETTDLKTLGWNGFMNGEAAPEGVYAFVLNMTILREDVRLLKTVKGTFHLLR